MWSQPRPSDTSVLVVPSSLELRGRACVPSVHVKKNHHVNSLQYESTHINFYAIKDAIDTDLRGHSSTLSLLPDVTGTSQAEHVGLDAFSINS